MQIWLALLILAMNIVECVNMTGRYLLIFIVDTNRCNIFYLFVAHNIAGPAIKRDDPFFTLTFSTTLVSVTQIRRRQYNCSAKVYGALWPILYRVKDNGLISNNKLP